MRCFRKSTTWCASALILATAFGGNVFAAAQETRSAGLRVDARVRAAIAGAVKARMGNGVSVQIAELVIAGHVGEGRLVATPDPSARTGSASIFALSEAAPGRRARRVGSATACVTVDAPHVVAARGLSRGAVLVGADIREETGAVDGVRLTALPLRQALVGARLRRDVAEGGVIADANVEVVPYVRSGDVVTVRARLGSVEAEGRAIASQSGGPGDLIRLVNPESRRMLQGRVVAPGKVEVLDE
jgi:flagella basal body P-ring formation protein FlgA